MSSPFKLVSDFSPRGDQPAAISSITKSLSDNNKYSTLLGVTGSGKTFSMAHIVERLGKKVLVLAHNKTLAAQLYAEFKQFFPHNAVEFFVSYYDYYQPEAYVAGSDTYIEKDASINDEIDKLRHSTTRSLMERDDVIVISSVSCIYGIGSPDEYHKQRFTLFVGDIVDRDTLLGHLVAVQYKQNAIDLSRGNFRVRGDCIDIFPAHEDSSIIRIEFFDQEVESIKLVDPLRGNTIKTLNKVTIYPKSHYVVGQKRMEQAVKSIRRELRERLIELQNEDKLVERQRLEQRTMLDLELLEEVGYCSGIENYSRHLTGTAKGEPPPTLMDFFNKKFLLLVDESHMTVPQVRGMYAGDRSRKEQLVKYGFRLPSALDNRPLQFGEFEQRCDQVVFISATPGDYELDKVGGEYVEQIIRPTGLVDPPVEVKGAKTQVDDLLLECKVTIATGYRVLVTTLTKKLAEELTTYYLSIGLKVKYLHSDISTLDRVEIIRDLRLGKFDILVGINLLREGLDIPEVALVAILDADKEGFLRSHRSLIQTIGRAARNANGRVIMYAYKTTDSMRKAIAETKRRRDVQQEYNRRMGITPKSIDKKISGGVIETLRGSKPSRRKKGRAAPMEITEENIDAKIMELKKEMKLLSKELKFEEAAKIRDEIKELNEARLLL